MSGDENLLRKLGVCEPIPRSFRFYFQRWNVFIPIGLVQMIPVMLFLWLLRAMAASQVDGSDTAPVPRGVVIASLVLLPFWIVVFMVGNGATIRATAEIHAKKVPALRSCLYEGFRRACALLCFGLVLVAAVVVFVLLFVFLFGLVTLIESKGLKIGLFIVVAIIFFWVLVYMMTSLLVTPPSIVLEKNGPGMAMRRSWSLVRGSRCYVFFVIFLMTVISYSVSVGAGFLGTIGYLVVTALWNILVLPLGTM